MTRKYTPLAERHLAAINDIRRIMGEEETACAERVATAVRPILVKEFRRVAKRYNVSRVLFGNGTCAITYNQKICLGSSVQDCDALPPGLHPLIALCDLVAGCYPVDDLGPDDLLPLPLPLPLDTGRRPQ